MLTKLLVAAIDPLRTLEPSGIFAPVTWLESLFAAALVAAVLYVADRSMAFHVCLYAAITSGKRFTAEEAYKALDNPFARIPRVALWAVITGTVFFLARSGGVGYGWPAVATAFAAGLAFVAVSGVYAFKAFRRTEYGVALADAVKEGRWRDS